MRFKALFYALLRPQRSRVRFPQMETYAGTSTFSVCHLILPSEVYCSRKRITSNVPVHI